MRLGRENLGVPGKRNPRRAQCLLVQRRSRHRGHLATKRGVDGVLHVGVARASGGGVNSAGFKVTQTNRANVEHARPISLAQAANDFLRLGQAALICSLLQHGRIPKNNRRAKFRYLLIPQQMQTNLRPNPGGITHRHGYFRETHLFGCRQPYFSPKARRRTGSKASAWRTKPRSFGCEASVVPSASSPNRSSPLR